MIPNLEISSQTSLIYFLTISIYFLVTNASTQLRIFFQSLPTFRLYKIPRVSLTPTMVNTTVMMRTFIGNVNNVLNIVFRNIKTIRVLISVKNYEITYIFCVFMLLSYYVIILLFKYQIMYKFSISLLQINAFKMLTKIVLENNRNSQVFYEIFYCEFIMEYYQICKFYNIQLNSMIETRQEDKNNTQSIDGQDKNATANMFLQNYMNPESEKEVGRCERTIKKVLESMYFQIFITIVALYSLFSDDIRSAATDASADMGFDIIHIILLIIFTIQIVLNWISYEDYRWSFFFVLDAVSSASLLLDVNMITQMSTNSSYDLGKLAAQSRASRVATRAVRIVKLVRIIRIIKLYKAAVSANQLKQEQKRKKMQENKKKNLFKSQQNSQKKQATGKKFENEVENNQKDKTDENFNINENKGQKQKQQTLFDSDFIESMKTKQSKISRVLSDLTIKKIIIVVLLLMLIIPLFDSSNYIQKAESWDYLTSAIHDHLRKPNQIQISSLSDLIDSMILSHQGDNYLIYFSTPFKQLPYYKHERFGKERTQDITSSVESIQVSEILRLRAGTLTLRDNLDDTENNQIYAVMSYRDFSIKSALFSMGNTIFICIVLVSMLHFFTEDINELIVNPIQKMMKQVIEMAKNPESVTMSLIDNTQYETAIVHNAIVKIGALLSLVFGSAGAQIIGSNIMSQGDMNPMIGGKKKCAIFGFCDIKQFTEVTELLQEDIMLFVNKIGELVHSSVYRYGGSANKNIGQAFLMIWPLPDNTYKINHKTNEITWKRPKYVSVMSDFSIFSFIKAIVKINKDPAILQYRKDKRLLQGIANYQVKMGFGLHIGWAIQGAIGSQYKIDASYLSPNVNMASRLEAATKQFGVNILISEDLYEMITVPMRKFCRNIDRVTVKGSAKPIRLYTIDLKLDNISPPADKKQKYKSPQQMLDVQTKKQINMQFLEDDKIDEYNAEEFIKKKKQLREVMVDAVSSQFKKRFELGLDCYINGKWCDAKLHLNEALKYSKTNDGPTNNILNYMKKFDYMMPESWKNYRPLTEK